MKDGDKILIQPGRGIGDLIMLTPILRELKQLYPHCYITIMAPYSSAQVISGLWYVDDICPMRGLKTILSKMIHQDYVIFFDYKPLLFLLAKILFIPHRIGPCKEKNKKYRLCTYYFPYSEKIRGKYQSDFYLEHLCKALQIPPFHYDYKTDVFVPQNIKNIIPKGKYICIAPFVHTSLPLPDAMIKKIIDKLLKDFDGTIVFVGNKKSNFIDKLVLDDKTGKIKNLLNQTTVAEFVTILANSVMTITTESGPMHIACAAGIPTISIFSTGEVERWCEKLNCYPIALHLSCQPCASSERKNECKHHDCINKIPFQMIEEQIDKLL